MLCLVTVAEAPYAFGWAVYGEDPETSPPLAHWRYDLREADRPDATVVCQSFTHGAGDSGVRMAQRAEPDRAEAILRERLAQLRRNMTATIRAMEASVRNDSGGLDTLAERHGTGPASDVHPCSRRTLPTG
ncbi:hypothetical protein ACFWR9_29225 [Streptomyces sp. NPDC058534]|uniref:hypothetical protein n=1 Tax=Streptomyces sp. NPDC058534 TaxID=3346541 RepID=UPI00364E1ACD